MSTRVATCLVALLMLAGCDAGPPGRCSVDRVIDLPLQQGVSVPAVAASFRGEPMAMLIDTGSLTSTVTRAAVDRFALGYTGTSTSLAGIAGPVQAPLVRVSHLMLGHGVMPTLGLPVVSIPLRAVNRIPVFGLFGTDILANYDVDIDVPHRHLGVYAQHGCSPDMIPFAQPFFEVPFHTGPGGKIEMEVKLNGVPIEVWLDSGAAQTVLTEADAARAGVGMSDLRNDRTERFAGVGPRSAMGHRHAFGRLEVGDETLHRFEVGVTDMPTGRSLLGYDLLRHNRVLISYWRQVLFIQPALGDGTVRQEQATDAGPLHPG